MTDETIKTNFALFGTNGTRLAANIAEILLVPLSDNTETRFDDDEDYVKSNVNVRGSDVYVVAELFSDEKGHAGEKLWKLLQFIGSLKDASAKSVNIIAPYLPFSRQDRKTESRAPITTKYVAKHLESAGATRLMTVDVHSLAAFQNAFRMPTDNLEAKNLHIEYIKKNIIKSDKPITILSPDIGGLPRANGFRRTLSDALDREIGIAIFDKERVNGVATGSNIIGNIKETDVIVVDDMIASGKTMRLAIDAAVKFGGNPVAACATHGLFTGDAGKNLSEMNVPVIVSDTVPPFRLKNVSGVDLKIISTAKLFATAIRITQEGGSISKLLS